MYRGKGSSPTALSPSSVVLLVMMRRYRPFYLVWIPFVRITLPSMVVVRFQPIAGPEVAVVSLLLRHLIAVSIRSLAISTFHERGDLRRSGPQPMMDPLAIFDKSFGVRDP